jgi:hypothetical protein
VTAALLGLYVGVIVVAGLQYRRSREPRLLLVIALFAALAAGRGRGVSDLWVRIWDGAAGAAGFALALALGPRARQ